MTSDTNGDSAVPPDGRPGKPDPREESRDESSASVEPTSRTEPSRRSSDTAGSPRGTDVDGTAALLWQAGSATAAVVGLQVVLPRVFSVVLWYHLGFLAVSLEMLGLAAGGIVVRRRVRLTGRAGGDLDRPTLGAAASLAIPLVLALVVRLPMQTQDLLHNLVDPLLLLAMAAAVALPFVLLGTVVCSALDAGRDRLGAVYGTTFFGGALGAALSLLAMDVLGLRGAAGVIALTPLAGLVRGRRPTRRWLVTLAVAAAATVLLAPTDALPLTNRKHFPRVAPEHVVDELSDSSSYVLVYDNVEHHGLAPRSEAADVPRSIGIAIDAWAITFIAERSGPDDFPAYLDEHQAGLAYTGARPGFEALVIGAGGGWDVLGALAAGASRVTAVELNPLIVDLVQGPYAELSGRLYDDPRVEVVVDEGRHFVEHDDGLYDRIVLAGVDTFAATQAGAFALAENDLYTVEAFGAYLRRLTPGGVLFMTRWWFEPPRQTLRLALTAAAALRAEGVDPRRRLFIAKPASVPIGNSLFFLKHGSDLTRGEIDALIRACGERDATPVYAWSEPSHPVLVEALDAADPAAWIDAYPYRVDPTTDDRPFFFEYGRLDTLFRSQGNWIHDRLGGQEVLVVTLLVLLLLALPAFAGRPQDGVGAAAGLPFVLLGFGYLFVEIPLLQRLSLTLGHPVLAVAVVLVGLLVWSGVGSLLARRIPPRHAGVAALATAVVIAVVPVLGHETFVDWVGGAAKSVRVAATLVLLAAPGVFMGTGFPLAVAALGRQSARLVPSAFLWNGLASVLAGPLAVLVAMHVGFRSTLLVGASCYALAGVTLMVLPRAARGRPQM